MSRDLHDLNASIEAYERMLDFYQRLLDSEEGGDEYIEERMHLLNCTYADLLVKRMDLRESVQLTGCTPSSESMTTAQSS